MARVGYFHGGSVIFVATVMLCVFSRPCNCDAYQGNHNCFDEQEHVMELAAAAGRDEGSFGVGLIRVGSPTATKAEQLRRAIERSRSRLHMFLAKTRALGAENMKDIDSPVHAGMGEFLMQLGIGTPPLTFNAILDTGSDLIWTQCKPCSNCYKQDGEIFDPSRSKTYAKVPCSSPACQDLPSSSCSPDCQYEYQYGDQSFTTGVLAYETFNLATTDRTTTAIPRVAFGCGHDNEGMGFTQASGLVGMGRGTLSLISQLGSKVDNKFSYCLVSMNDPPSKSSPLLFGSSANLRGPGINSTPLLQSQVIPTFYYLQLEGVSVGGSRLDVPAATFDLRSDGSGGIIIDSGTTITYLENAAYRPLKTAVQQKITLQEADGSGIGLDLCYKLPSDTSALNVPAITFHFAGGADFDLPEENAFLADEENRLLCLAFAGSSGISIFGNIQQQNFHILYDLGMNRLSFVRTTCDAL